MQIPFLDLTQQYKNIKKEIDHEIRRVISSGRFIMGEDISSLEEALEEYLGIKTVSCANGSDALFISLKTIGLEPGDEVITTPFTFFATAGAVVRAGGTPVFVDIEEDTFNINPELIQKEITKKTKAIIPVHIFGHPADMDPIMEIAKEHDLYVIEDACQAIGSEYKKKKLGSIGHLGCFSFFPTKNLGGFGDGGLMTAQSVEHYEYKKMFRVHGASQKYYHDFVGINSRLDALQAVVLKVKLKYLDSWNDRRRDIAKAYSKKLKKHVVTPTEKKYAKHIYHQYSILTSERDALKDHLKENEVAAGVYYPVPLHLQACFKDLGYKQGDLPVAEQTCDKVISLPIFPEMTDDQVEYVGDTVSAFFS